MSIKRRGLDERFSRHKLKFLFIIIACMVLLLFLAAVIYEKVAMNGNVFLGNVISDRSSFIDEERRNLITGYAPLETGNSWYVDNAVSSSGDGTSWANAWKSFANIIWSRIQPGDTLYISGGATEKTYTDGLSVEASGNEGRPITIAVDASNPLHNGKVIFDYDVLGDIATGSAGIGIIEKNYVTISDLPQDI